MSTNEFSAGDVFRDGLEGGLSELVAGAMVGSAKLLWKWVSTPRMSSQAASAEVLQLEEEAIFAGASEPTFLTWPDYARDCGEDFLNSLIVGDHTRVCNWCEPTLFQEAERKERLLNTLSYSRPTRWVHANSLTLKRPRTGQDAYGLDYDVVFNVDGRLEAYALLLVFIHHENGLAVSDLYWEWPGEASWRQCG